MTDDFTIELCLPEETILDEIRGGQTQSSVALTYAMIIRQRSIVDWARINQAIQERWTGKTALLRVKTMAWKLIEQQASR